MRELHRANTGGYMRGLILSPFVTVPLAIFVINAMLEGRWRDAGEAAPILLLMLVGTARLCWLVFGRR